MFAAYRWWYRNTPVSHAAPISTVPTHPFQPRATVQGEPGVCSERAVRRLYAMPEFQAGQRAVRTQLAVEQARAAGGGAHPPSGPLGSLLTVVGGTSGRR